MKRQPAQIAPAVFSTKILHPYPIKMRNHAIMHQIIKVLPLPHAQQGLS